MQIGLQQGTQIVQVMQQMGGGKQALQGIAAGFMSLLNPINLVTIGVVALGAVGIQALMGLGGGAKAGAPEKKDEEHGGQRAHGRVVARSASQFQRVRG